MSIDIPSTPLPDDSTMNPENAFKVDSWQLSQLLFIVGHVAMKHIVHMEVIEEEFKRRKAGVGSDGKKDKDAADDELDQVVGTTEDEFGDAMAHIRERELLFGEDSLLQVFGPLIITICGNNTLYSVSFVSPLLRVVANAHYLAKRYANATPLITYENVGQNLAELGYVGAVQADVHFCGVL